MAGHSSGLPVVLCTAAQTRCRMPAACGKLALGKARARAPRTTKRPAERGFVKTGPESGESGQLAAPSSSSSGECRCHGPYTRAYRGSCLPSFMVIGSQKAATSKLRWYHRHSLTLTFAPAGGRPLDAARQMPGPILASALALTRYLSRHPSIDIPKEEAFHGGPNAVAAWDTTSNPTLLTSYLEAFEDVCNASGRITGLKMPDYIVMSAKTIDLFHKANAAVRAIVAAPSPLAAANAATPRP